MTKNLLDDIDESLSAYDRAEKLQTKAAKVGFDWENSDEIIEKIEEEIAEIRSAINKDGVKENLSGQIGDLNFRCINLARY